MTRRRFDSANLGPIGPDIDVDEEEVRAADGGRLTEKLACRIGEEATGPHRGRLSVTGQPARTPNLTVRVAPAPRDALEAPARAEGRKLADASRDAFDEYIGRHAPDKGPPSRSLRAS